MPFISYFPLPVNKKSRSRRQNSIIVQLKIFQLNQIAISIIIRLPALLLILIKPVQGIAKLCAESIPARNFFAGIIVKTFAVIMVKLKINFSRLLVPMTEEPRIFRTNLVKKLKTAKMRYGKFFNPPRPGSV